MNIQTYLQTNGISQSVFASMLGVTQGLVSQWIRGSTPVHEKRAVLIEQLTNNSVTRQDLRPDDFHLIWPELVEKVSP